MGKSVRQKDEWGGTLIEDTTDDWGGKLISDSEKKNPVGNDLKNGTPDASQSKSTSISTENNYGFDPMANIIPKDNATDVLPNPTTPKTQNDKFAFNPNKNIEVKKPIISIAGNPIKIDIQVPFSNVNEELYAKELQERINSKTYNQEDVNTVAKSMDVPALAASALMDGKTGAYNLIRFNDRKETRKTELQNAVVKANSELGINDNFDQTFASAESASAYLDKIEKLYKDKENTEAQNALSRQNANAKTPSTSSALSGMQQRELINSFDDNSQKISTVVNDIKKVISNDIIDKVSNDSNLTKEQKVKKIYSLTDSRGKKNTEEAISNRLAPFRFMENVALGRNSTKDIDLLNADKGGIELKLNRTIKEKIDYNNAAIESIAESGNGVTIDNPEQKKEFDRLQLENERLAKEYVPEKTILEKYPVLNKARIVSLINDYNAIKSGNVKGYEDSIFGKDYAGYMGTTVKEMLLNNGIDPNSQIAKDALKRVDWADSLLSF